MFIGGGPPDNCEGACGTEGGCKAVICPVCQVIWQTCIIQTTFTPEEQERFWEGKGCPDCHHWCSGFCT